MTDEEFLLLEPSQAARHVSEQVKRQRLIDLYAEHHQYDRSAFVGLVNYGSNASVVSRGDPAAPPNGGQAALGVSLMILGALLSLWAFTFNVSVDTSASASPSGLSLPSNIANFDLISIRSMILQVGGYIFLGGCIFAATAGLRKKY